MDFPGIPLKHFVDNYIRYDKISHDEDCKTTDHEPFFLEFIGERQLNTLNGFEPEVCPQFP